MALPQDDPTTAAVRRPRACHTAPPTRTSCTRSQHRDKKCSIPVRIGYILRCGEHRPSHHKLRMRRCRPGRRSPRIVRSLPSPGCKRRAHSRPSQCHAQRKLGGRMSRSAQHKMRTPLRRTHHRPAGAWQQSGKSGIPPRRPCSKAQHRPNCGDRNQGQPYVRNCDKSPGNSHRSADRWHHRRPCAR